ncbi:cation transporter [Dongia deserti]|uniref:cation transporter n=1 Tax=Dongia deserti TaxID=2268030 RepID=UPI00254761DE|nr:cation diffusion facilitator family transporter [Dongia deserti]
MTDITPPPSLRRAVLIVAGLNLGYFLVEFTAATSIGSVSLFADSIDFLEDTSVNLLIMFALGWSLRARSRVGIVLAGILLVPGLAALWTVWEKIASPLPPEPITLSVVGAGALVINVACALILVRFRKQSGSLTKAAFLSARNDAYANLAIIAAGFVTAYTHSIWPDIIVGLGIAAMNATAAKEVWEAARAEGETARS